MDETQEKVRENYLRRSAKRQGFILQKSRAKKWSIDNYQEWRIIDFDNIIRAGEKFNLSLDEVEAFLTEKEEKIKK
jgi:hypothetical protein